MNYIEIELFERKIRFYDENHIELEFKNKKDNWKPVSINSSRKHKYKTIYVSKYGFTYIILVHRLVFYSHNPSWDFYDVSKDNVIDHIDGNKQNNSITNLQCVSNQENSFNRKKAKGYSWCKRYKKWRSKIQVNRKSIHLGYFDNEEDARNAYLEGKKKYHIIKPRVF
jgi:hypothetical protein